MVSVKIKDIGKWGRIIGQVTLPDGKVLNSELVGAGMAWVYRAYSMDPGLLKLEAKAKESKLGLWVDPKPVAPWQFRRMKRKP